MRLWMLGPVTLALLSVGIEAPAQRAGNYSPSPAARERGLGGEGAARERVRARSVHLVAVGDILLAGPMGALMEKKGRAYPFAALKPVLQRADIAFGNLECCVATVGQPLDKKFTFRANPDLAPAPAEAGFRVLSLANNHAWDYGRDALMETVRRMRRTGVVCVGAGANRAEAHRLRVVKRHGLRIGFLAYLGLHPALLSESETSPCLAMATPEVVREEVAAARDRCDFVIVSLHCGHENETKPTAYQRILAHAAIDAGADMVIGHHPHVVQAMETYRGKPICYSLGNFVFSTTGRGTGAMLDATLYPDGEIKARLLPLQLAAQPHFPKSQRKNAGAV